MHLTIHCHHCPLVFVDCARCGRRNPDHIKYCLDCGSVLTPGITPSNATTETPPRVKPKLNFGKTQVVKAGASLPDRLPQQAKAPSKVLNCLICGASNPASSRFCRECGSSLKTMDALNKTTETPPEEALPSETSAKNEPAPAPARNEDFIETAVSAQPSKSLRHQFEAHPEAPVSPQAQVTTGGTLTSAEDKSPAPKAVFDQKGDGKSCSRCGAISGYHALFCQICGHSLDDKSPQPEVKVHAAPAPKAELVVIAQDGSPGKRYDVNKSEVLIGKGSVAEICLEKDPYVSESHARLIWRGGQYVIEDLSSINGVYVRIQEHVELRNDDQILMGLAVLKFEVIPDPERNIAPRLIDGVRLFGTPPAPRFARLKMETVEELPRDIYYLSRTDTVLGREIGEIVFTSDPFMSRRHAAIRRDPNTNRFTLRDLGSSNGTFVSIRRSQSLQHGDHIRVGQHLFRLDVKTGESS